MPKVDLVVGRDPRALLEHAADGFLTPLHGTDEKPFPTPPYLLALRQGGIRDDLIALANYQNPEQLQATFLPAGTYYIEVQLQNAGTTVAQPYSPMR